MPGFPELPDEGAPGRSGALLAAELWRSGRKDEAVVVLEGTVRDFLGKGTSPPGWLVVRLAKAYHFVHRNDDEIATLERHLGDINAHDREQVAVLLSKARTLADRRDKGQTAPQPVTRQRRPPRGPTPPESRE